MAAKKVIGSVIKNAKGGDQQDPIRINLAKYKIIGCSRYIKRLVEVIEKAAETDSNVLIQGPTGRPGKEFVAHNIHLKSKRNRGPFVAINRAQDYNNLFESELFGIESRIATGVDRQQGKIAQADGGGPALTSLTSFRR